VATAPVDGIVVASGALTARRRRSVGEPRSDLPTGLAGSLHDCLSSLETGATPMGECHDNIKSLAMVLGALESAASGRRVQL